MLLRAGSKVSFLISSKGQKRHRSRLPGAQISGFHKGNLIMLGCFVFSVRNKLEIALPHSQ